MHEQPRAVADTLLDRLLPDGTLALDEVHITDDELRAVDKVFIVACGSSYHAGLMAKYAIEHWARLPVEIDIASEFRYRDPVLDARTLVIGVSQSGETVDTFAGHARGPPAGTPRCWSSPTWSTRRWPARPTPSSTPGPAPRSAWPPPRPTWPRSPPWRSWPSTWPRPAGTLSPADARDLLRGHGRPARQGGAGPRAGPPTWRRWPARYRDSPVVHLPRAPRRLPGGPRGGAQAEGALLPAGRGVPRRRAQARPHRPGRAGHGGHRGGHPHPGCGRR